VVQIILNNESLDFVNIEQQEAGIIPFGVEFKNPNFAKVAEAMGAKGIRIEEPGDVREGLTEALAHKGGPVVVDVVVDPHRRMFLFTPPKASPLVLLNWTKLTHQPFKLSGRMISDKVSSSSGWRPYANHTSSGRMPPWLRKP
jgi:hypothetical protein